MRHHKILTFSNDALQQKRSLDRFALRQTVYNLLFIRNTDSNPEMKFKPNSEKRRELSRL